MDVDTLSAIADLAGVDDAGGTDCADCEVNISVGGDDGRGFSAQFK